MQNTQNARQREVEIIDPTTHAIDTLILYKRTLRKEEET